MAEHGDGEGHMRAGLSPGEKVLCHSAHLFSSVFLVCLTSVTVQTQVALVIRALDCDHAQPRTRHQIWNQASQVKPKGCGAWWWF